MFPDAASCKAGARARKNDARSSVATRARENRGPASARGAFRSRGPGAAVARATQPGRGDPTTGRVCGGGLHFGRPGRPNPFAPGPAMATVAPPRRETPAFQPYVSAADRSAELTPRALVLGALLGIVFAASSVYLALKIGLTVSASIPIAVLAVAFFRTLGRSTILENNIVQTTGSSGESIAAGVVFTVPAILLMGYDLSVGRVTTLALV